MPGVYRRVERRVNVPGVDGALDGARIGVARLDLAHEPRRLLLARDQIDGGDPEVVGGDGSGRQDRVAVRGPRRGAGSADARTRAGRSPGRRAHAAPRRRTGRARRPRRAARARAHCSTCGGASSRSRGCCGSRARRSRSASRCARSARDGTGMTKRVAGSLSRGSASSGTRRASSMRRWPMNGVSPISRSCGAGMARRASAPPPRAPSGRRRAGSRRGSRRRRADSGAPPRWPRTGGRATSHCRRWIRRPCAWARWASSRISRLLPVPGSPAKNTSARVARERGQRGEQRRVLGDEHGHRASTACRRERSPRP